MNKTYPSITSLNRLGNVRLMFGDEALPYVEREGQYYYFVQIDKDYHLVMTSSKDLQQEQQ